MLEGLRASDRIMATGIQVLHKGQQVRPIDQVNRAMKLAAKG